jgi:polyhydroxybutyrate depolymerase
MFVSLALLTACTVGPAGAPADGGPRGDSNPGTDGAPAIDAPPTTLTTGATTINLTVAGTARTAILYVPTTATATSQVAIALHGNGDSAGNFLATSGLKSLADADGTILVIPQGLTRNFTVVATGQTLSGIDWDAYNSAAQGNLDLPLLDQLRAQVVATGQVDPHHVFVFGYSQGGYLSFTYAMTAGASLSCGAVLAASSPFGGATGDPLITGAARKLPTILQIGTNDSAYGQAQITATTLSAAGFPTMFNPITGPVATPWGYCRGKAL